MKKYDSYKDSGIEWIGMIPSHWDITRLRFLGSLYSGLTGKSGSDFSADPMPSYKPFVNFTNVANNTNIVPTNFGYVKIVESEKQNLVKKGDLLFLMSSENQEEVGKCSLVNEDFGKLYLNSFCKGLRLNGGNVNPAYLSYLLNSAAMSQLVSLEGRGFTRINLRMEGVHSLPILLPSGNEQTAIANYLDRKTTQIDDLISKKQRLIALLEEERTALINQAVTKGLDPTAPMKDSGIEWLGEIPEHWEVKRLKQIFNSSKGLTITKENLENEGVPCVNYGEIHSKFGFEVDIDKHKLKCVNPKYLESDHKSLIHIGDFVFADTSEDISGAGNFTYLKSNHEIFAGYHTIILRALCDIESRYFAYQFDSIPYRTQIRQSVKGIKVFSITQGILKNTSLWHPPLHEQRQIIKFLDVETERMESLINSTIKEIELLKEYKTALISDAVTGKVDVRN
jgi:type I restriction enzyme, S subunit